MQTLKKFWHWADNENPSRELFDAKATNGGPLSEEAQEAMQQAVEVVSLRAPDILHPTAELLRPAIKLLSFAILEAWQLLKDNEQLQAAMGITMQDWIDGKRPPFSCPTGKAKDIIQARKDAQNAGLARNYSGISVDAPGYIAYDMRIPNSFFNAPVECSKHNVSIAMDTNVQADVTVPAICQMGVTRSWEHDDYRLRLIDMMSRNDREHLSVHVDSRGILFRSIEFNHIEMLCDFSEFKTQDYWRLDEHKLYLVTNTLRLHVIREKERRAF